MNDDEVGPPHNRDTVLNAIGRAAAPPVPTTDNGPSLGALTGISLRMEPRSVLCVGTESLTRRIQAHRPIVPGVPGMLSEIAASSQIETLVVEGLAFRSGPWIGADDHQSKHLAEEIFEAGRLLRARGGQAWFVPTAVLRGSLSARVLSTFTAHLGAVPEVDLEEGAVQSPLWAALLDLVQDEDLPANLGQPKSPLVDDDGSNTSIRTPERTK